ncbi:hypothetical protein [Pedobacter sp. SYP-B3415]|uniref:hypothetical protein n=1 Tax=Pedobacter sp. SYP-B3415 TaxID=2496641 RepID=UPI0013EB5789|nr:hypothetical protein [Pedobacter sp. SYP-B3415]
MLAKLGTVIPGYARQRSLEESKKQEKLTKGQWVTIDRIVMLALLAAVITGAVIFS